MASSVPLKRFISSNLIPSSLRLIRPAAAPSASRLFNTNAVRPHDDDEDVDERGLTSDSRSRGRLTRSRDNFFSDVFDPFGRRSLSQVLNAMDQLMENPFLTASRGMGAGVRGGWDARETADALNLRVDMPGLDKEHVKVWVEQNTLIIKGEGPKEETEGEESGRRYSSRIDLPEKIYRTDEIKAEMKNGVLKVVVPKVKENQRTDVFSVQVD